jgi:hypothetical protein
MIFQLFHRNKRAGTIRALYGAIVAQARRPAFYRGYGAPDSVEGRFDMIVLHAVLFFRRTRADDDIRALGQLVFDGRSSAKPERRTVVRSLPVLVAALALAGCDVGVGSSKCTSGCTMENHGGEVMHGSGTIKTETRSVEKFTAVRLSSSANVVIERTGTEGLTVTGDDNLVSLFISEVKDGTLHLSYAKGKSFEGKIPVYRITVSDLRKITVTGSGDVDASKLEGNMLSVSDTGSGDIRLGGQVDELVLGIEGSGDVNAAELKAKRAKVALKGSGDATVNVSDELDAKISGSGDLSYIGSPKVTSDVSGSGSIKPKP